MVETVRGALRILLLLMALIATPFDGRAHQLDEYLQATLVSIEPDAVRVQINLTPGAAIARRLVDTIDRDRDGTISTNEERLYVEELKRDLSLRLDGRAVELKLAASDFPATAEMLTGWGIISMEFRGKLGALSPGLHKITLENRHLPAMSGYLFNAAPAKSEFVKITAQKRNMNQSRGEIEFGYEPAMGPLRASVVVPAVGPLLVVLLAVFWRGPFKAGHRGKAA
jgi:hypothetical protein